MMTLLVQLRVWWYQVTSTRRRRDLCTSIFTIVIGVIMLISLVFLVTRIMHHASKSSIKSNKNQAHNKLLQQNKNMPSQSIDTGLSEQILLEDMVLDALNIEPINHKGETIYATDQSLTLAFAEKNKYFNATGFSFCHTLENSSFDATIPIRPLQGSVALVNPDIVDFTRLIDSTAHSIYERLMSRYRHGSEIETKRVACYFAAEGNAAYTNLTHSRLLVELDPIPYFKPILPTIMESKSVIPGNRRKYKIAYLLMVHEYNGFPHLVKLLEILDDGDGLVLIHVDARSASEKLYLKVKEWIAERMRLLGQQNVFLAQHRFHNIWGHISLVFTQLSGFWELLDMADWDYVINLSNYDYPLKRNADIHRYLSQPKYKNKNFIEYWPDTADLAERFFRAHMGQRDYSSIYHPHELGVTSWPNPRWRAYKHHQWMIITPELVKFFRTDRTALNLLAFMEHTYIPDESYFATALVNSPRFKDKVINDNKRYLRFDGADAHPKWLGYNDRFLFPYGEEDPSFYFIRKMNVYGDRLGEPKLIKWIAENHHASPPITQCTLEHISTVPRCLKQYLETVARKDNTIILLPLNEAFVMRAANVRCSLRRLGLHNVVYWALDLSIHNKLINKNRVSIYLTGSQPYEKDQAPKSDNFIKMMREKTRILRMILDVGFNVWYLDADTFALRNFVNVVDVDPTTSVFLSAKNKKPLKQDARLDSVKISTAMMYLRAGTNETKTESLQFLDLVDAHLKDTKTLSDQAAIQKVVHDTSSIELLWENPIFVNEASKSSQTVEKIRSSAEKNKNNVRPVLEKRQSRIRVRVLNQLQFIDGDLLFTNYRSIPSGYNDLKLVHLGRRLMSQDEQDTWGLYLLNEKDECSLSSKPEETLFKHLVHIAQWKMET